MAAAERIRGRIDCPLCKKQNVPVFYLGVGKTNQQVPFIEQCAAKRWVGFGGYEEKKEKKGRVPA